MHFPQEVPSVPRPKNARTSAEDAKTMHLGLLAHCPKMHQLVRRKMHRPMHLKIGRLAKHGSLGRASGRLDEGGGQSALNLNLRDQLLF